MDADRESNASGDNDRDETMEDVDDAEPSEVKIEPDGDNDTQTVAESQDDLSSTAAGKANEGKPLTRVASPTPPPPPGPTASAPRSPKYLLRPMVRQEAVTAKLYDIVPTMAAPQSTSINAMAITPDLRYWFTGGSDCYIRKFDGPATINGKQLLTVAQRHPFVDSVTKAAVIMGYWANEEPTPPSTSRSGAANDEPNFSPVYSLAVHSEALWLLSGLESGGINLQSVRHDEGKRITCLQKHTNAVSVLNLQPDERGVYSGSWDKTVFDWDLNTGQVRRSFEGSGGQISAIELRPASGAPIPSSDMSFEEPLFGSDTYSSNNGPSVTSNSYYASGGAGPGVDTNGYQGSAAVAPAAEAQPSPAHESLFGGSDDAGSLFGEGVGGAYEGQHDEEFSHAMEMTMHGDSTHEGGMDHSADIAALGSASSIAAPAAPSAPISGSEIKSEDNVSSQTTSAAKPAGEASAPTTEPSGQATESGSQSVIAPSGPVPNGSSSPNLVFNSQAPPRQYDMSQVSEDVFLSASMDGTIRLWDRRVPNPVARIGNRPGVPPWCMGVCWSPDGNWIYAGRRNGTVEEFNIHKARGGGGDMGSVSFSSSSAWLPERSLKFPAGSGPVSALRPMPNGRHLICASYDIMRLYDLRDAQAFKHSSVPFLIVPGPPRAGVISSLYIDHTARFMISVAGTRGWEGSCTEVLIGYEIGVVQ